jgi:predicted RNase H-like HicB family nuclease
MLFPMIVYKSEDSSYCGLLPDFAGCYPMAESLDALVRDVQGAVETWMEGEDPSMFPAPTPIDAVQAGEDAHGRALMVVDVDTSFMDNATQRINITTPRYALSMIDKRARERGMSRSAYMVRAALDA